MISTIERSLGNFRRWVYSRVGFLIFMGIFTLLVSMSSLGVIVVDARPTWLNSKRINFSILSAVVIYAGVYCMLTYRTVSLQAASVPRNHPNIFCIYKGSGKAFVLVFFMLLDSTLKNQNKLYVILLCVSFGLHLVHFTVVFGVHEEFDLAGGFAQASIMLLYEITTAKWQVWPILIGATIFTCYQVLLIEGVPPRNQELPRSEGEGSRQTGPT